MKNAPIFLLLIILFSRYSAQINKNYQINGIERKAIIYEPSIKTKEVPVVFVFHGHGGNAQFASQKIDFQNYYPEALVIFMEGIPGTSGYVIDKEGKKNGWQMFPNQNGNRDIQFFDEVLKDVEKKYNIDENRIYIVGHSNGARFVNVLWKERGEKLAALCSVAAQGGIMIYGAQPVSVWMSMGKKDPLVPFENQQRSIPIVKKNLSTDEATQKKDGEIAYYQGDKKKELAVEIREAGHEFPHQSIPKMVEFFKRNPKN